MSVIEASSVGVKTMADGTLRVTMDIEPRHARDAFALFGAPGTAMALAALHPTKLDDKPPPISMMVCNSCDADRSKEGCKGNPMQCPFRGVAQSGPVEQLKGGALAKLAGMWCNEPRFQLWLTSQGDFSKPLDAAGAADVVRSWCRVKSRAELDSDPIAEEKFQKHIRGPYMKHLQSIVVVA